VEPTVSPDAKVLFYRRGKSIFAEQLQLNGNSVVSVAAAKQLEGIEVIHLYACTQSEEGQYNLWIESTQHEIQVARFVPAKGIASLIEIPCSDEIKVLGSRQLAENLTGLRSLRPDGYQAYVNNDVLVWERDQPGTVSSLGQSSLHFVGSPIWVGGDSSFLFINALAEK
jgi:hypothetical protein